jgi:acyl-CoA synthetase (AMP-forming)/AMP-acid ligase II
MAYNLADFFEHSVDAMPDRMALVVGERHLTYKELDERANRLAHHLAGQGVGPGDHVAVYAHNSTEWVESLLAAFKLRAIPINVNYRYVEEELHYLLENADAVALIYEQEFEPLVKAVADRLPLLKHTLQIAAEYDAALATSSPERGFEERSSDDIYILYTGGTTGFPKGVVWRHEDVWRVLGGGIDFSTGVPLESEFEQSQKGVDAGMPGVSLPVAPLMHGAGQWGTMGGLFGGNTVVLVPKFDPHVVWETIEREKVMTLAITGDAMARPLIEALGEKSYDTSSLFAVSSTAAIFSPVVQAQFLELLPNVILTNAVGSTETGFNGMVMLSAQASGEGINVSMGPDTIVIGDDNKPLSPGTGELGRMARGGNVPVEYYKDPEKTAATFVSVDGKRYAISGDVARVEPDGTMTLFGRGSQCINSGGEKIFPEEVEAALKSHPAVFDALVVGVADERWGQKVTAVVQPRPGVTVTLDDLDAHCRTRIAGYKVPRGLHLVDQIQRQPSGKPDYPWAKQVAERQA